MVRPVSGIRTRAAGLALVLSLLAAPACDTEPTVECPRATDCPEPPATGPVVEGVDLDALFAPPTQAEIDAVAREVAGRPPSVASVETVATVDLGGRETVRVVAGRDASGAVAFVGAVHQPPRPAGDQRARPLRLILTDGPDVDLERALGVPPLRDPLDGEFVSVVLAYRGQRLSVAGRSFGSDVPPEPYDRDADDALALVAHARASASLDRSDPDRLLTVGWGRGGTVALLATARGLGPDMVVTLGAPSDFFLPSVRADARRFLTGAPVSALPALASVLEASAAPVRDRTATVAQARLALLRRSPAPFTRPPPYVVAVHGGRDQAVPVEHGQALTEVFGTTESLYLQVNEADHTSVLTDGEVVSTVSTLVCERVLSSEPVCDA